MEVAKKILRILTYVLFVVLIGSFFLKGRLVGIGHVSAETLKDPIQTKSENQKVINFQDNGYNYEATPLYDYKLNGVVVHKTGYNIFGSEGSDKTAPYDLCMVWGENVKNKTYLAGGIKFQQDSRWCFYSYTSSGFKFYPNQLSNNHLLIKDKNNSSIEKSINVGDEVEISGHLVNVVATKINNSSDFFTWNSSTSREDSGAGACEVILVDSIKIKQSANIVPNMLFQITLYLLPAIIVLRFLIFAYSSREKREKDVPINFTRM